MQKRNKFNATTCSYNGMMYHSKLEASKAMDLDWLVKAKEVKAWTGQHKLELYVTESKICNYYIDFRSETISKENWIDYIEIKGFETETWRLKWKLTIALFEGLTEGENARLWLNTKLVETSYK